MIPQLQDPSGPKEDVSVKRMLIVIMVLCTALAAQAADQDLLAKAKAEKTATFYANITSVEPIMDTFAADTGVKGNTPASPPRNSWPRS